jgi:predicted permease
MKLALRSLLRTPGFTLVAIATLALGIGASTTVFTWIERVLLEPLPGVAAPARIVALETRRVSGELIDTSYPDFRDYAARTRTLAEVLVFKERPLNLGTGPGAERVWGELVSGNFFAALGVQPRLGRFFAPEDRADEAAAAPVAVISEALWRRRFQSDPGVLGRTLKLNQHDYTIIGVAPAAFLGTMNGLAFDVWVPLWTFDRLMGPSRWLQERSWRALHTLARLAPGATLESTRAELDGLAAQLAEAFPGSNRGFGLTAMRVTDSPHGVHRLLARPLWLGLGACGLVLLIGCANLSNLLLVRASGRQREMCIRRALGAGAGRIVAQLLLESLVLSAAGAAAGIVFTLWMSDALPRLIPEATLPIALSAGFSGRGLAVAVLLALGTAVLAGLAPALWVARPDLIQGLRGTGRLAALTPRAELFRRLLAVGQIALALVTLACAALAAKSFHAARQADPGFVAPGVLLGGLKLDASGYTRETAPAFLERLQARLAELPGVEQVALAENVPLGLDGGSWEKVSVPDYPAAPGENLAIYRNLVSPGYFSLLRIPLVAGREFNAADRRGAPLVAMVSEAFARRFFGRSDAVGRTFSIGGGARRFTIVGVARDIRVHALDEAPLPYFYLPVAQAFQNDTGLGIHLRVRAGDPLALLPALRATVRALDPGVPVFEAVTLADFIQAARFTQKAAAALLGVLSAVALALTSLGLYGVLAFAVAQRVPEIGVRLALGARPADISRLFLGRGGVLIALGLALGLAGALALGRVLAHAMMGVSAFEPLPLAAAAVGVVLPALAACWLPARRAARVDPLTALRAE